MKPLNLKDIEDYIQEKIGPMFHDKKKEKIEKLTIKEIVTRKNIYLFRAKIGNSAHEFVKSILDATLSSGEETLFGNFIERVAVFVCEKTYGGKKSATSGIDLEFEYENKKYLVSIKSGPNWGNSSQLRMLISHFNTAKKTLGTSSDVLKEKNVICVEGCCYGIDNKPNKGTHLKLCGQRFWELISGNNEKLYRDIIKPLGHSSEKHNRDIQSLYIKQLNTLTGDFLKIFCKNGAINWDYLIKCNSEKSKKTDFT